MADPIRVSFEPVDHDPFEGGDIARSMTPSPTMWDKWGPEIDRKSGEIGSIVGRGALMPAQALAAPLISLAQKSHDNLYGGPNAIPQPPMTDETYGDPKAEAAYQEALKRYHGETFMDLAGITGGNSIPAATRGAADSTLGMFFAAPKTSAAEAEKMLAAGSEAKDIWSKLGVFQGKDGHWRTEVAGPSSYQPGQYRLNKSTLGDAVDQSHVYEQDQRLASIPLTNARHSNATADDLGFYQPSRIGSDDRYRSDYMWLNRNLNERPDTVPGGPLEVAQHETQHAIQQRNRWAPGTSPEELLKDIDKPGAPAHSVHQEILSNTKGNITPRMDQSAREMAAYEAYRREAGETEARNSAKRERTYRDISAREGPEAGSQWLKDNPPWTTEDVPRHLQWTSNDSGAKAAASERGTIGALGGEPAVTDLDREMLKQGLGRAAERRANDLPVPTYSPASSDALMSPNVLRERLGASAERKSQAADTANEAAHEAANASVEDTVQSWRNAFAARGEEIPLWLQTAPRHAVEQARHFMTEEGGRYAWLPDWFKEMYRGRKGDAASRVTFEPVGHDPFAKK
jgi:hypothetical protein